MKLLKFVVCIFVFTVLLCSCSGLTPSPYAEYELDFDGAVSLYTQDNVYVPDAKSMRL